MFTFKNIIMLLLPLFIIVACSSNNNGDHDKTIMETTPEIQMPVRGTWELVNSPGHDRYEFDMVALDDSSLRRMNISRTRHFISRVNVENFYGWSKPVYAPIDGKIIKASDGWKDRKQLNMIKDIFSMFISNNRLDPADIRPVAGNYVIMEKNGYYLFLAHLQEGSIQVSEGDTVYTGEMIGRVGNSGLSLYPHLHIQFFDQIDDFSKATAPPFRIARFKQRTGEDWKLVKNSEFKKGEIIKFNY